MKIPELIIDECLLSNKLTRALKKAGIAYKQFPQGTPDIEIVKYMYFNNAVLVTEDGELGSNFTWERSLLLSTKDPAHEKVRVIQAFMDRFKS